MKQRRKFERIETSNMNNQDTSSVNHVSGEYTIRKLPKCIHGEVQTLADCCKESIKQCFSQEKNEHRRRKLSDPISVQENHLKMNKTLLCAIAAAPIFIFTVAFSTTYIICIRQSHADLGFHYISDTALDYPESSIAAQALNLISIAVLIMTFTRHLVLKQYLRDFGQGGTQERYINILFWMGLFIALSIQLVGNFPAVNVGNITLHFVAVVIFFLSTSGYYFINTKITYHTIDVLSDRRIYYLRYIVTKGLLITGLTTFIPGLISWQQFNGESYRRWQPSDGGWVCHVISVISEWLYVIFANIYTFSLAYEFPLITFYMPEIKIKYLTVEKKVES